MIGEGRIISALAIFILLYFYSCILKIWTPRHVWNRLEWLETKANILLFYLVQLCFSNTWVWCLGPCTFQIGTWTCIWAWSCLVCNLILNRPWNKNVISISFRCERKWTMLLCDYTTIKKLFYLAKMTFFSKKIECWILLSLEPWLKQQIFAPLGVIKSMLRGVQPFFFIISWFARYPSSRFPENVLSQHFRLLQTPHCCF